MKVVSQLEIEFTLPENNLNLHSQIVIRQEILTVIRRKPSNNQVNSSLKIKMKIRVERVIRVYQNNLCYEYL